jgi:hypothetical protein
MASCFSMPCLYRKQGPKSWLTNTKRNKRVLSTAHVALDLKKFYNQHGKALSHKSVDGSRLLIATLLIHTTLRCIG